MTLAHHIEQLLVSQPTQPDPVFVARTRTIVLLHAAQVFPTVTPPWSRLFAPLTISFVALFSIVLILLGRYIADQRELTAIQQEIQSVHILDEQFM